MKRCSDLPSHVAIEMDMKRCSDLSSHAATHYAHSDIRVSMMSSNVRRDGHLILCNSQSRRSHLVVHVWKTAVVYDR